MAILFNYADRRPRLVPAAMYKGWILELFKLHNRIVLDIQYVFCSDDYLLAINRDFLQHDYYTDIITFDLSEPGGRGINAEIYISWDRIRDNAQEQKVDAITELRRVMAHGALHLCGFRDKTKREKLEMTQQEDVALRLWEKLSGE